MEKKFVVEWNREYFPTAKNQKWTAEDVKKAFAEQIKAEKAFARAVEVENDTDFQENWGEFTGAVEIYDTEEQARGQFNELVKVETEQDALIVELGRIGTHFDGFRAGLYEVEADGWKLGKIIRTIDEYYNSNTD